MVLPGMKPVPEGTALKLCIRPNEFVFAESGIPAMVTERVFFGDTMRYTLQFADGQAIEMKQDIHEPVVNPGAQVFVSFRADVVNAFDAETEVSVMKDVVKE